MGVNVTSRKRRNVGQDDEAAWAGTIVLTSEGMVVVCVSDIKWEETKDMALSIKQDPLSGTIDFKEFGKVRGYLIHIVGTYPQLTLYGSTRRWTRGDHGGTLMDGNYV